VLEPDLLRVPWVRPAVWRVFQITYYGLHQFFLTERAIYVIVWDATKFEGMRGKELDQVSWCFLLSPICCFGWLGELATSKGVRLQVHVFCFFSSATISRFVPNLRPSRRVNPAPTLDESLNYCSFPVVHVGPTPTFKQYADCRRRRFLGRSTYSGCPLLAFFADGGGTQFVRDQDLHVSNATASLLVPTGLVSLCIVDIET